MRGRVAIIFSTKTTIAIPLCSGDNEVSLHLPSDRPIKKRNWICQSHIAATWGRAGRCVCCGGGAAVSEAGGCTRQTERAREWKWKGELCCNDIPSMHTAQRCSVVITEVCNCYALLFVCARARGGGDISLFVGISGSEMWLWCDYTGDLGLSESLKVTIDVLVLMCLPALCPRSDCLFSSEERSHH